MRNVALTAAALLALIFMFSVGFWPTIVLLTLAGGTYKLGRTDEKKALTRSANNMLGNW